MLLRINILILFFLFCLHSIAQTVTAGPQNDIISLLVNQVGYDVGGEKILVLQIRNRKIMPALNFQLINNYGKIVFSGKLLYKGRINKESPGDWGASYWTGNFTGYNDSGEFRIRITVAKEKYFSFPFRIGHNLVYEETIMQAEHFFLYQRCGFAVPGIHPECHMDDAIVPASLGTGRRDASGGWHDAGDLNKYATIACRSVYALLVAARIEQKNLLQDKSRKEILDEGLWGADWLLKMWQPGRGIIYQEVWDGYDYFGTPDKQTDNIIGNSDDRPFRGEGPSAMTAAALAAAARATGRRDYKEAAEDLWIGAVKSASDYPEDIWGKTSGAFPDLGDDRKGRIVRRTADLLIADLELVALTNEKRFADNALSCIDSLAHMQRADGLWPTDVYSRTALQGVAPASLALYLLANPVGSASAIAKKTLRSWRDGMIRITNNPFRLIPWDSGVFFNPNIGESTIGKYYYVGQNSQYLSNAWALYLTAAVLKEKQIATLANRQLDWILGLNPYNLSMLEGRGSFNSPCYLHWAPDNNRGAVPGAIPNGFCREIANQDRPWFDLYDSYGSYNTLEPWEPHNAFFILAVSARAEMVGMN